MSQPLTLDSAIRVRSAAPAPSSKRRRAWAPVVAMLCTAALITAIVLPLQNELSARSDAVFEKTLFSVAQAVQTELASGYLSQASIVRVWNDGGPRDPADWRSTAQEQLDRDSPHVAVIWLDPQGDPRLKLTRPGFDASGLVEQLRLVEPLPAKGDAKLAAFVTDNGDPVVAILGHFDNDADESELYVVVKSLQRVVELASVYAGVLDSEIGWQRSVSEQIRLLGELKPDPASRVFVSSATAYGLEVVLSGRPGPRHHAAAENSNTLVAIVVFGTALTLLSGLLTWLLIRALRSETELDQTNAELHHQRAVITSALTASADALIVTDADRVIRMVSDGFVDIFGYGADEMVGRSARALYSNELQYEVKAAQRDRNAKTDTTERITASYRRKNGQDFPGDSTVGYLRNESGELVGYVGTIRDMTTQRALLEKIQRSEYALSRASRIARVGGWSLDLRTQTLSWSDMVFEIHEVDKDSPPTLEEALAFYGPESRQSVIDSIEEAKNTGTPWDSEYALITRRGKRIWARSMGEAIFEDGEVIGLQGVFQDLSEIRKLRVQRAHLFNNAADMFAIADHAGGLIEINEAWSRTLGWSKKHLLAESLKNFIHPDDREKLSDVLHPAELDEGLELRKSDLRFVKENGSHAWLSLSAKESDDDRLTYIVARDVTQRRMVEDDLRNREHDLQRSNEELEQFAYIASHDLNEPLRKVRAFGDRLLTTQADRLDERGINYVERMQDGCARMSDMIQALLRYSRAGRELELDSVDFGTLVHEVVEDLQVSIEESGANLKVGELPVVNGNATQLAQLVQNLISNSIRFAEPSRPLQITIESTLVGDSDRHRITLADNGIGFESNHAERIFELFQRLHPRTAYGGTGLGLAICRRIVEAHGGTISATGELDAGAAFSFDLPGAKPP